MHGNFCGKKGVVERNRASDETRAVLEKRGRVRGGGRGARGDSQYIGAVVRWHVEKWVGNSEGGQGQARAENRRRISGAGLIS